MMAETRSPAVTDYLARLEEASRLLPDHLRAELVGQVREHLTELERSGLDDVGLRVALERFGTPEQLVAAEADQAGLVLVPLGTTAPGTTTTAAPAATGLPAAPERRVWGGLELASVLLLALGGFVAPVLAPVVGMVLALLSPRWTRRTKVGALLAFCSPALVLVLSGVTYVLWPHQRTVTVMTSDGPVEVPIPDHVPGEPMTDTGSWQSTFPVVDHGQALLVAAPIALAVLAVVGGLVAGLWLAFAGRQPRRAA